MSSQSILLYICHRVACRLFQGARRSRAHLLHSAGTRARSARGAREKRPDRVDSQREFPNYRDTARPRRLIAPCGGRTWLGGRIPTDRPWRPVPAVNIALESAPSRPRDEKRPPLRDAVRDRCQADNSGLASRRLTPPYPVIDCGRGY